MPQEKAASDLEEPGFPFQEYLKEPESPEEPPRYQPEDTDLSTTLAGTFEDRLAILQEAIDDIDGEIGLRLRLSRAFKEALQGEREWIGFKLSQFDRWHWGDKPSVDFRRTALERELMAIYREMRSQGQRAFTDIAGLKKERRKLLMEHRSLKATQKALAEE